MSTQGGFWVWNTRRHRPAPHCHFQCVCSSWYSFLAPRFIDPSSDSPTSFLCSSASVTVPRMIQDSLFYGRLSHDLRRWRSSTITGGTLSNSRYLSLSFEGQRPSTWPGSGDEYSHRELCYTGSLSCDTCYEFLHVQWAWRGVSDMLWRHWHAEVYWWQRHSRPSSLHQLSAIGHSVHFHYC